VSAAFGRRSTAEQVTEGLDLRGRHAVVTGANTGIGFEAARVLALRGADVTLACRDQAKASAAAARIAGPGKLDLLSLDLGSLASVRSAAETLLSGDRPIHWLLNNAGVMLPDRRETSDGHEAHFGINHLGHFLLTTLLLPRLAQSAPARVVAVSSEALHFASLGPELGDLDWLERKWSGWRAYGDSKLMNLLFAVELSRRFAAEGVVAHALHPGMVKTELGRELGLGPKLFGMFMLPWVKGPARGAATTLYAATRPELAQEGGGYFADCAPARRRSRRADDPALAALLWKKSEELCTGGS
jgi:NAD(P)-dependent dehydrogenase (short-subunit alcohol dehydrogenase family)